MPQVIILFSGDISAKWKHKLPWWEFDLGWPIPLSKLLNIWSKWHWKCIYKHTLIHTFLGSFGIRNMWLKNCFLYNITVIAFQIYLYASWFFKDVIFICQLLWTCFFTIIFLNQNFSKPILSLDSLANLENVSLILIQTKHILLTQMQHYHTPTCNLFDN